MKTAYTYNEDPSLSITCNALSFSAPFKWLRKGIQDFRRAPLHSLTYGAIFATIGWLLVYFSWANVSYLVLALFISVLLLGPALAFGLYDISQQLEQNQKPRFSHERRKAVSEMGHELMLALVLGMMFMIMIIFTSILMNITATSWQEGISAAGYMPDTAFFAVAVIFGGILFCANLFALPMIVDKDINAATAISASITAVWRNKAVLLLWALLVLALTAVGFATALIGFLFIVPVLGYASWHAYRETIKIER